MRKMKRFLCYLLLFSALLELFSGSVPVQAEEAIVPGVAAAETLEEVVGLLNPGGPIAQFKRNHYSTLPVEVILLSGVRT